MRTRRGTDCTASASGSLKCSVDAGWREGEAVQWSRCGVYRKVNRAGGTFAGKTTLHSTSCRGLEVVTSPVEVLRIALRAQARRFVRIAARVRLFSPSSNSPRIR